MDIPSRTSWFFRTIRRFTSFIFQFTGISKMIGYDAVGLKNPRPIFDPINGPDAEWKNAECDCNVMVSEVDLTMF